VKIRHIIHRSCSDIDARIFHQQNQIVRQINGVTDSTDNWLDSYCTAIYMMETFETEAAMAVTADKPAPYATARSIIDLIERYRERGLATPVNMDVLARAGVPPSLIPRTLQALKTLDLIDESGQPTQTFEGIRLASEDEFKTRLGDWLKGAYADVFSFVDPTKDDETRIRDAFRTYQPVAQQPRMVSLFQGLCAAAGLLPAIAIHKSARLTEASIAAEPRLRGARATARRIVKDHITTPRNNSLASGNLPPALAGLLASLPTTDDGWTGEEREKFLKTFEAVLDFCIPVVGDGEDAADEASGQEKIKAAATRKATAA
jgi:hypothetical protein